MRLQDTAPELDWTIFADVLQPESETAGEGAGGKPGHRSTGEGARTTDDGARSLWRKLVRLF